MSQTAQLIRFAAGLLGCWLSAVTGGLFLTLHPAWPVRLLGLLLLGGAPGMCMGVAWLLARGEIDEWVRNGPDELLETAMYSVLLLPAALTIAASLGHGTRFHTGPAYQATFGQRTEAIITEAGARAAAECRVSAAATERDLGQLAGGCTGRAPGERIEVSVDPLGWAAPVAVDQLGAGRPVLIGIITSLLLVMMTIIVATTVIAVRLHRRSE